MTIQNKDRRLPSSYVIGSLIWTDEVEVEVEEEEEEEPVIIFFPKVELELQSNNHLPNFLIFIFIDL